jgi:hypothetical protein
VLQGGEDGNVGEEYRVLALGVCANGGASEARLVHGHVFGGGGHGEADVAV